MASVSASHSCGNSWATCETGQCCWHSCSVAPSAPGLSRGNDRTDAAYPSLEKTRANASAGVSSGWEATTEA